MRTLLMLIFTALLPAAAATATAGEFTIAPFIGYASGASVEEIQTGTFHDDLAGPEYGLIAGFEIGPSRWIEVLWSHQDVEFCEGCLPDEPGQLDLSIDSFHLGGVYQPGTKSVRPFAVASAGVTVYSPGSSGTGTTAGFSFAIGGGAEILLADWLNLRLDGRGWFTFASGTLFGGCNGGCSIGFSGDGSFQIRVLAALVVQIP